MLPTRLRSLIARPLLAEMRATLASMARTLTKADAEIASLEAERDYLRSALVRYSHHLDNIRCDLADAGVPIPEHDDPELTPRRMVRAMIDQFATKPRPRAVVPEGRRMAVLRAVDRHGPSFAGMIAYRVTSTSDGREAFAGLADTTIERAVSALAAEGWLLSDGKRNATYALTSKGYDALAAASMREALTPTPSGVAVAS